jgi:hypothetical protein
VGYTWEENGPAIPVRKGVQTLATAVENMASLPFVDVLYIGCDWRNVQSQPGRLDLHPVWDLTLGAAKRHGLRSAFRIQLSNPEFQPQEIALPTFLGDKVPLAKIGRLRRHGREVEFVEPRYDHPAFQSCASRKLDLIENPGVLVRFGSTRLDEQRSALHHQNFVVYGVLSCCSPA